MIAVIGKNGAGKSTFSCCLCGLEKKFKGKMIVGDKILQRKQLLKQCYMVMQKALIWRGLQSVIQ